MNHYDVNAIRKDFPILHQRVNHERLVYFDNAATTQKPQEVIDAIADYYTHYNANVHRAVHTLGDKATQAYEDARKTIQQFIHANTTSECVFVRGATEAINLVASSFVMPRLQADDEIIITEMEHHSNIVPWQLACQRTGAKLRVAKINDRGEMLLDHLSQLFTPRTKFFALGHVSNAFGTINPVKQCVDLAHQHGVPILIDGAQAAPHLSIDVQALGCDFYAISGHKMYGPTGIGVLYGKAEHLEAMPPYQSGGEMIARVCFDGTEYNAIPHKFEAGTPNIVGAIGLAAAVNYLHHLGLDAIQAYEHDLLTYATLRCQELPGFTPYGTAADKAAVLAFNLQGSHPSDVGTLLDKMGIAIRAGHHCAMPAMAHFHVAGTARASFALYNTREEVDVFINALEKIQTLLHSS